MALPHRIIRMLSLFALGLVLVPSGNTFRAEAQAPSQDEIRSIAGELAEKIQKSKAKAEKGQPGPKVLVLIFPLAEELSAALKSRADRFVVAERQPALDLVRQLKLPPREYTQLNVAAWLGWKTGAQLVVTGHLAESGGRVRLDLSLVRVDRERDPVHLRREFARTAETLALVESGRPRRQLRLVESEPQEGEPVAKPGKNGVGSPKCAWCPNPQFTEEGVRWLRSYQGIVLLRIVVTADGKAKDIEVLQGAACGLTERAVAAVRQWRFEPARDADGNPVAVRISIEVNFRTM